MATTLALGRTARPLDAYLGLARPRAILPHLITATAAMVLAAKGPLPVSTLLLTLVGGGCVAGAANTFNSYLDRDIDALMTRTRRRPLPSGLVTPNQALAFGTALGFAGVAILSGFVDWLAAMLAVEALAYYVLPYTLWLKRRSAWGAVIGSGVGVNPPLIGWVVVTHRIGATPLVLSAIIILWTLPHFWTLAVSRRADYARAGLDVLPRKGLFFWIVVFTVLLVATSILLAPIAGLGAFYLVTACLLGSGFLYLALRMSDPRASRASRPARRLHGYSVLYIALLFAAIIVDRVVF